MANTVVFGITRQINYLSPTNPSQPVLEAELPGLSHAFATIFASAAKAIRGIMSASYMTFGIVPFFIINASIKSTGSYPQLDPTSGKSLH